MRRQTMHIISCITLMLITCTCVDENLQISDSESLGVAEGNLELIFQSGFEEETRVVNQRNDNAEITGVDHNFANSNNWEVDLNGHPQIGYFNIQYQGGNDSQRLAEIASDPLNLSNNALKFWIKEPNVDNGAGRVQANIYSNNNIKELHYSVRLLISSDLKSVENAPFPVEWLTIMEFWNNANWSGENYQYRMSVNLQKSSKDKSSLEIGIKSQVRGSEPKEWLNPPLWEYVNNSFAVPVGTWMRIDIHFVEGDRATGRFIFSITPDGGKKLVVHDIRNFTHHPEDPNPDGLSHFNPMKLYTSGELIDYVGSTERLLNLYWDDFRLSLAASQ